MNKREDRREGNRHCKERSSKDKVINTFPNNYIEPFVRDVLIKAYLCLHCKTYLHSLFPSALLE